MEALGPPRLPAGLDTPQTHQTAEGIGGEPALAALGAIAIEQYPDLALDERRTEPDVRRRRREIALIFGHLVLEDQVTAEGVPGELGDQPVILVPVVAAVREDYIRHRQGLERLEVLLDGREVRRHEAVTVAAREDRK